MGGVDKGLIEYRGQPLVTYALNALQSVAGCLLVSANRNGERYATFGYPVISDLTAGYEGPLAGLLAAMRVAHTPYVMAVPVDCPMMTGPLLGRLVDTLASTGAEVCVPSDGTRLQPVFMLAQRRLCGSLDAFLAGGQRKVDRWLAGQLLSIADFSDHPDVFVNINTPEDLMALDRLSGGGIRHGPNA